MAKFYGVIGFIETQETAPGVWTEVPKEYHYYGDIFRNVKKYDTGEGLNKNINVNNQVSIVADPYASEHFFAMRYLEWMGSVWEITNVEVQPPRLILTIGGVYNGQRPSGIASNS